MKIIHLEGEKEEQKRWPMSNKETPSINPKAQENLSPKPSLLQIVGAFH